jgi:hypothetical protein
LAKSFKVTFQCSVTSIFVQPIPSIKYDIGVGGAFTTNLPLYTVTPSICQPFVKINWKLDSAAGTYITLDPTTNNLKVSTADTSNVGSYATKITGNPAYLANLIYESTVVMPFDVPVKVDIVCGLSSITAPTTFQSSYSLTPNG